MRMARFLLVAALGLSLLLVGPAAFAGELEDRLQRAHDAEFSGQQLVLTTWSGETALDSTVIQRLGGVTAIEGADGDAYVGGGRVQGPSLAVAVTDYAPTLGALRYQMRGPTRETYLGREAEVVEVFEGDLLRAAIMFDVETGAPLTTEIFDASGERFRVAYMLSFSPKTSVPIPLVDKLEGEYDVLLPVAPDRLSETVAGYTRADAYEAQDGTLHAFYSDGLFSFSVFELEGAPRLEEAANAVTFERDGTEYRALVTASDMTVTWTAAGNTYVLIGDLPPDHLERALVELPHDKSLLSRIWSGLFG